MDVLEFWNLSRPTGLVLEFFSPVTILVKQVTLHILQTLQYILPDNVIWIWSRDKDYPWPLTISPNSQVVILSYYRDKGKVHPLTCDTSLLYHSHTWPKEASYSVIYTSVIGVGVGCWVVNISKEWDDFIITQQTKPEKPICIIKGSFTSGVYGHIQVKRNSSNILSVYQQGSEPRLQNNMVMSCVCSKWERTGIVICVSYGHTCLTCSWTSTSGKPQGKQ